MLFVNMAASLLKLCNASSVLTCLDGVTCPICLEIYESPQIISCGHTFCKSCLNNYKDIVEPACPLCRTTFKPASASKASDLEKKISSSKGICKGCEKKVRLVKLREHQNACDKLKCQAEDKRVTEVGPAEKNTAKDAPNRYTFKCPICGMCNLDTNGLTKHVNENHFESREKVVCPICASMPWGDPTQKSMNFIAHLNLRHKFEYHTLVDYELDDDAALRQALEASMEGK